MPRPGWYNDNENRTFPFQNNTAGLPYVGTLTNVKNLPDYFIVDCGFTIGSEADYVEGENFVYLYKVSRSGSVISFEFRTTDSEMADTPLVFTRDISDDIYSLEYLDSDAPPDPGSESESYDVECRQPFWSGYLVTGDMTLIAGDIADGASITNSTEDAKVELALVQNLSGTAIFSMQLANTDRTRVTGAEECDDPTWPFTTGETYETARCLVGDVRFKEGYNISISTNPVTNTITFSPVVGAGEGEPCEEVKLFPEETPPIDSTNNLLEGGPLCNELIRAVNGIGGPVLNIFAGNGVSITPEPDDCTLVIDVNLNDLDLCGFSTYSIG